MKQKIELSRKQGKKLLKSSVSAGADLVSTKQTQEPEVSRLAQLYEPHACCGSRADWGREGAVLKEC